MVREAQLDQKEQRVTLECLARLDLLVSEAFQEEVDLWDPLVNQGRLESQDKMGRMVMLVQEEFRV